MKVEVYVDRLFQGYKDTPELQDFKEEITINLQDRIAELQNKGFPDDEAFDKAIAELGDITGIADQISRQKRNEVIEKMYIHSKVQLSKKHVVGYVVSGGVLLFGLLTALISYFVTGEVFIGIASLLPFFVLPCSTLVFLGLTQETTSNFPMSWKRALIYAVTTGVILFGLVTSTMLYFMKTMDLQAVLGVLIPFVIPGLCLLAFLVLTEEKRHKPWVVEEQKMLMEYYAKKYSDPQRNQKRGLLSGALWLFAIALFVIFGFWIGFKYSWVVFLFAIAGELVIEYWMHTKA